MRTVTVLVVSLAAISGCGSESNPFNGDDGGAAIDGGTTTQVDAATQTTDDAGMQVAIPPAWPTAAQPTPARMVMLGDSILACSNVGGTNGANCAGKQVHNALAVKFPGVLYQNYAVGGAVTTDVPSKQLANVPTGIAGHVLVVIMIGGNDLSPYIFQSDATTMTGYNTKRPMLLAAWEQIFTFFADTTKFPDGVTMLMAQQYNPFDDCTASPYNLSPLKIELLHSYNGELIKLANDHAKTWIVDQFTSFLGHGHHYNVTTCPNFIAAATPFMDDLIHPNVAGHQNLSAVWIAGVDKLYLATQ